MNDKESGRSDRAKLEAAEVKARFLKRLEEIGGGDRTEPLRIAERLLKIRSDLGKMKNKFKNKKH